MYREVKKTRGDNREHYNSCHGLHCLKEGSMGSNCDWMGERYELQKGYK